MACALLLAVGASLFTRSDSVLNLHFDPDTDIVGLSYLPPTSAMYLRHRNLQGGISAAGVTCASSNIEALSSCRKSHRDQSHRPKCV